MAQFVLKIEKLFHIDRGGAWIPRLAVSIPDYGSCLPLKSTSNTAGIQAVVLCYWVKRFTLTVSQMRGKV